MPDSTQPPPFRSPIHTNPRPGYTCVVVQVLLVTGITGEQPGAPAPRTNFPGRPVCVLRPTNPNLDRLCAQQSKNNQSYSGHAADMFSRHGKTADGLRLL